MTVRARPVLAILLLAALAAALPAAALAAGPRARAAIVGGQRVDPAAAPFFAFYEVCGGSLVAPDLVLTASHCVEELTTRQIPPVEVGVARERRRVVRVAQHPFWVALRRGARRPAFSITFDLALLKLARPVSAPPIGLAPPELLAPGAAVRVFGRGVLRPGERPRRPPALRAADQVVVGDEACGAFYRARPDRLIARAFVAATMVCSQDPRAIGRRVPLADAACQGDSGGPVTVDGPAGPLLAGVVSWGLRCGQRRDPDVSAEVPALAAFAGNPAPVWWPSSQGRPRIVGSARVGGTVRCVAPRWDSPPEELRFRFLVRRRGNTQRASQRRANAFRLRAGDRGEHVGCAILATNAGGTDLTRESRPVRVRG
jgi:hypothetical protein